MTLPNNTDASTHTVNVLIFVYQADSGLFNTVADIAHKIFSPQTYQCKLCSLTHSYFTVRDNWTDFVKGLPVKCEFLHRDEFYRQYPIDDAQLPAVFVLKARQLDMLITSNEIKNCSTLEELEELIRQRLEKILDS